MKTPYKIEPVNLTLEILDSDDYEKMEQLVQSLLTEKKIDEVCTHEAGHIVLFKAMGEEASPRGPLIYIDRFTNELDYVLSGIKVPLLERKHSLNYTVDLLADIGRGAAAGGIFLEHFLHLPEAEWGDACDKSDFMKCWQWANRAIEVDPLLARMFSLHWEEAQNKVRLYMKTLTTEQEQRIEGAKREVRACFIPELPRDAL